jgi:hypothetical protein
MPMPLHLLVKLAAITLLLSATSCAVDTTDISEESFCWILPGQWSGGYDAASGTWVYLTASGEEGVTVGMLAQPAGAQGASPKNDLDAYLQARRRQEQQFSDETLALSKPSVRQTDGGIMAVYDGVGATSRMRTRTLIMVNDVTAVSFHYEAFGMSEKVFAARAQAVLRQASLAQ